MYSRIAAVALGLIAGIAAFLFLMLDWNTAAGLIHVDQGGLAASFAGRPARMAAAISTGASVFAVVALLIALIGGLVEVLNTRARIEGLRHDPALAGRWNAADWRAAFAQTAIADRAEAMITLLPIFKGDERRVVVDTALLIALNPAWLDRLTLTRTISPLPRLVLGQGATFALLAVAAGGRWEGPLVAGTAGWLAIGLAYYITRAALGPLVGAAVASATAAIRPLTSPQAIETAGPILGDSTAIQPMAAQSPDVDVIAAAIARALSEPLARLTDAADRLGNAIPTRDQTIDSALAEIRAGIERLLASSREDE